MLKKLNINRRSAGISVVAGGLGIVAAGLIVAAIISAEATDPVRGSARDTYSRFLFTVEFPVEWKFVLADEPTGNSLENIWSNPTQPGTIVVIHAEVPPLMTSPAKSAHWARTKTKRGRERPVESVQLAGRPAARWVFDEGGSRRVVYFTNQCEVGITAIASTPRGKFGALAKTFDQIVSSVEARCP